MKISFEGREWDYDPDLMDVKQAMVLHMTYGLTIGAWNDGFVSLDQRSYHFAYWHVLQQNGVVKPIGDCNPQIIQFISAYVDAQQAEAAEAKAKAEAEAASVPELAPFPPAVPPSREPAGPPVVTAPPPVPQPTGF